MKTLLSLVLATLLVGCHDSERAPEWAVDAIGSAARIDVAVHHRLAVIEKKLGVVPPAEDLKEIQELADGIEKLNKERSDNENQL